MNHFDREFYRMRHSWKGYVGSILFTVLTFILIASTRFGLNWVNPETETELMHYYLPPPPAATKQPLSLVSKDRAAFDIQFPDEKEPIEKQPIETLPLDFLNVSFGSEMDGAINIDFDLRSKLLAVRPDVIDRLVIYERDQVDEKPVRLYAPSLSLSSQLREEGAELLVLYRVTKKGRTEDIHVLDSTNEEVNSVAFTIISRSRFRPARKNGNPVNVWVQHEMIFKKEEHSSPFSL